jgi:hypothetical protein
MDKKIPRDLFIAEGKTIEAVLRKAVNQALLTHKRAENPIATWKDGKVVIMKPSDISIEDEGKNDHA